MGQHDACAHVYVLEILSGCVHTWRRVFICVLVSVGELNKYYVKWVNELVSE